MSYALGATPSRANAIQVGSRASKDPILARASYEAASILLRSTKWPRDERASYIESQLRRYNAGTKARFQTKRAQLIRGGSSPNQATFDAMRLIIANHKAQLGVEAIQGAMARTQSTAALGSRDDELVGCAITGGATAVVGTILSVYTGAAGGAVAATSGQLVGQALDCGKEQREAQVRLAELEAQRAQAMADAAAAAEGGGGGGFFGPISPTTKKVLIGGGAVLALLIVGFVIVKV